MSNLTPPKCPRRLIFSELGRTNLKYHEAAAETSADSPNAPPKKRKQKIPVQAQEGQKKPAFKVKAWEYRMCGSITAAVDRYLELSNFKKDSLKKVGTPCIDDHLIPAEDFTTKGIRASF